MPTFDYICEVCGHEGREWRKDKPPRFCSRRCKGVGMSGQNPKRTKWVITPFMDAAIKKVYQQGTGNGEVRDLALRLKLPYWKVKKHAANQGYVAIQKREPDWSPKELKILEHSAHLHPSNIRKNLKKAGFIRSEAGIILKRRRLNILKNLHGQSATNLAQCFGVDTKVVTGWIQKGYLQAGHRGTVRTVAQGGDIYFIKDKQIRNFILNYPEFVDLRKVDKFWFINVLVPDWGPSGHSEADGTAGEVDEGAY